MLSTSNVGLDRLPHFDIEKEKCSFQFVGVLILLPVRDKVIRD